jgi:MFS superfamily sulfate permease-like transporter
MNLNNNVFSYWRRDAVAGIITGMMAIPLSVGICLMSEYPVQTGLITVVAACLISFITYLLKPGNYVGVPGVAAGLAPALAMGIHTFGMQNMPFLILLTACIQAIVWKFNWQKYILQLVPNYLVEGLLAGIGLKIALKFLPFTYLTFSDHHNGTFFGFVRGISLAIQTLSKNITWRAVYRNNRFRNSLHLRFEVAIVRHPTSSVYFTFALARY